MASRRFFLSEADAHLGEKVKAILRLFNMIACLENNGKGNCWPESMADLGQQGVDDKTPLLIVECNQQEVTRIAEVLPSSFEYHGIGMKTPASAIHRQITVDGWPGDPGRARNPVRWEHVLELIKQGRQVRVLINLNGNHWIVGETQADIDRLPEPCTMEILHARGQQVRHNLYHFMVEHWADLYRSSAIVLPPASQSRCASSDCLACYQENASCAKHSCVLCRAGRCHFGMSMSNMPHTLLPRDGGDNGVKPLMENTKASAEKWLRWPLQDGMFMGFACTSLWYKMQIDATMNPTTNDSATMTNPLPRVVGQRLKVTFAPDVGPNVGSAADMDLAAAARPRSARTRTRPDFLAHKMIREQRRKGREQQRKRQDADLKKDDIDIEDLQHVPETNLGAVDGDEDDEGEASMDGDEDDEGEASMDGDEHDKGKAPMHGDEDAIDEGEGGASMVRGGNEKSPTPPLPVEDDGAQAGRESPRRRPRNGELVITPDGDPRCITAQFETAAEIRAFANTARLTLHAVGMGRYAPSPRSSPHGSPFVSQSRKRRRGPYLCSECGKKDHNKRTCPNRAGAQD